MTDTDAIVFVVDDDERIRQSLRNLIRSVGLRVKCSHRLRNSWAASCRMFPDAWCSMCGCPERAGLTYKSAWTRPIWRFLSFLSPATATSR